MLGLALAPLLARLETIVSFREALSYLLKSYINENRLSPTSTATRQAPSVLGRQPARWETRRSGKHAKE